MTTDTVVRRSITVAAPPERAFEVFTSGMTGWWPREYHIGENPPETIVMEPRAGGRWYERDAAGTECMWGFVTEWEPPHRVLLAWHLDARWAYDPDKGTPLEIRFTAQGDQTLVELEHSGFEVHGDQAGAMLDAIGSDGGWNGLLQKYAAAF
jgi:uncharacterized protein YndB with AHSA1/START domain